MKFLPRLLINIKSTSISINVDQHQRRSAPTVSSYVGQQRQTLINSVGQHQRRSAPTVGQHQLSVSTNCRSAPTVGQQQLSVSNNCRSATTVGQQQLSVSIEERSIRNLVKRQHLYSNSNVNQPMIKPCRSVPSSDLQQQSLQQLKW